MSSTSGALRGFASVEQVAQRITGAARFHTFRARRGRICVLEIYRGPRGV